MFLPCRSMLMSVVGLLASSAIGFPLNPSFTPEAVKEYKVKADAGDAEAQYLYSSALANGKGVAEDLPQAFIYAKKAADQGYERALRRVGLGYERGWGVESNSVKAAEYYSRFVTWATKAAEQGDANAQRSFGICYEYGNGVKKDAAEAVKWYRKAAEQGDASAQNNLGLCYENGDCVEKDAKEAVKWYRKAAEQGLARAQWCLGDCYYNGYGVEKNEKEAMKWWRKAAEQGYKRENLMRMVYVHLGLVLLFALLLAWWKRRTGAALNVYWLNSWHRCFDFSGRSSKREYVIVELYSLFLGCLTIPLVFLGMDVLFSVRLHEWYRLGVLVNSNPVSWGVTVGLVGVTIIGCIVFPLFALAIRRFHDVGKSGWCEMLWFVPVWGWIQLWCLLLREGDPARNKYGDPPTKLPSTPNKG